MSDLAKRDDPGLYDFWPYRNRKKIVWPGGKRLALWIAPNIEFYEYDPPANPTWPAWNRPSPDILNYSHCDYGNRVGVWRLLESMDRHGIRGSVSLSISVCDHHPEIIAACAERGWEFFSHGIYNTRFTYGMSEKQERALIEDCIETVERAAGQKLAGWLSPALTNTPNTMELLAEYGIKYTCDLFHDDQPQPLNTTRGRLISIPYSLEMNDVIVYKYYFGTPRHYYDIIKNQFDQLYEEGQRSGTVMCIPLHPFLVGQPHRLAPFDKALEYIASHSDVWFATGREIAEYYHEHYYDSVAAEIAARGWERTHGT